MDELKEECGVFGIFGHPEAANLTYLGLYALQHRGQESAGIAAADGHVVTVARGMGYVADIFDDRTLSSLTGRSAIGHTRYSTAGESRLANAQPFLIDCVHGQMSICHNGNLVNAGEIRRDLVSKGSIFQTSSDTEVVLHLYARSTAASQEQAAIESLAQVQGAYSILMMSPDRLIAARDPHGFRPLALGRLGDAWIACSETCALDLIGATYVRDVEPGEVVVINASGLTSHKPFAPAVRSHCVFEHVYFARPDSYVFGRSVNEARTAMGRRLAEESMIEADVVVPIPDSGVCAAIGFSEMSGIPMRMGLIRNHYVGRTFIQPQQSIRHFGVRVKLNPVRSILEGRRVILIDDSIVRGTTSRKIVQDGQGRRGARSPHAHQLSADDLAMLLRRGHAAALRAHRRHAHPRGDPHLPGRRFARVPESRRHAGRRDAGAHQLLHVVLHRHVPDRVPEGSGRLSAARAQARQAGPRARGAGLR